MSKLLTAFENNQTIENARKLVAHDRKHPMASCLLSPDEHIVLRAAYHRVSA